VLCDALALAAEDKPALMLDFATLTGSARSAVGAEIAAMFSNTDETADAIFRAGQSVDDAVWRMPLHRAYNYKLDSNVADLVNSAATPFAGAVTAALFLERFVGDVPWVHFDIMAMNTRARPGRPEGGEAMAIRAVFEYLEQRFSS
jgi:leucyl aminopeptidase